MNQERQGEQQTDNQGISEERREREREEQVQQKNRSTNGKTEK